MNRTTFEAEVRRLTELERRDPKTYRRGVTGLVVWGYLALFLMFAGASALVVLLTALLVHAPDPGTVKLAALVGIPALTLAATAVRSTFVRFDPPSGVTVTERDAPALLAAVESIRTALGAPPLHRVVLTGELNAAMLQRPRLGYFGWYENILVLGLPLLRTFDATEVSAIIAHELGHAAGAHGRFGARIYRVRASWMRLAGAVQGRSGLDFVGHFLNGYMPRFLARTFVLARAQEYEADAASVRISGADTAARALVRLNASFPDQAEGYLEAIWRRAASEAKPPMGVISGLVSRLAQPATPAAVERALNAAWYRDTDAADTHPALRDRLRGMGVSVTARPAIATPVATTAATAWLGAHADALQATLDLQWQASAQIDWSRARQAAVAMGEARRRLEGLPSPSADERFELSRVLDNLEGPEASWPLTEALAHEGHAGARYLAGLRLLQRGDASGLSHLTALCAAEPSAVEPACELAASFLFGQARVDEAHEWLRRKAAAREAEGRSPSRPERLSASSVAVDLDGPARAERAGRPAPDRLRPHGCTASEVGWMARELAAAGVSRAVLAEIHVQHRPDVPWFLLVVDPKLQTFRLPPRPDEVVRRVHAQVSLPGQTLVVTREGHGALAKVAATLPGARILG